MIVIFRRIVASYDSLEHIWEHKRTERFAANLLIMVFLASLALIELAREGLLPEGVAALLPKSHYYAINTALSMLLGLEVFGLVFSLAKSVSVSVGKQFEILSLILLRHSFNELVHFSEPPQCLNIDVASTEETDYEVFESPEGEHPEESIAA